MSEPVKTPSAPDRKRQPLIYVVDDEALLLDLAEASLAPAGYHVRKFQNAEEALAQFRQARRKPALLVSDYAMGEMNGLQLIAECKRVAPELKTLLVSGTATAEILLNATVKVDRFLGKPYQPPVLVETVRELLQG